MRYKKEAKAACAAAEVLRAHAAALDDATREAAGRAQPPEHLLADLAARRVWPADAYVDLELSDEVVSARGPAAAVCALGLGMLDRVRTQLGC